MGIRYIRRVDLGGEAGMNFMRFGGEHASYALRTKSMKPIDFRLANRPALKCQSANPVLREGTRWGYGCDERRAGRERTKTKIIYVYGLQESLVGAEHMSWRGATSDSGQSLPSQYIDSGSISKHKWELCRQLQLRIDIDDVEKRWIWYVKHEKTGKCRRRHWWTHLMHDSAF